MKFSDKLEYKSTIPYVKHKFSESCQSAYGQLTLRYV